jgi:hypothetical protein
LGKEKGEGGKERKKRRKKEEEEHQDIEIKNMV